MANYDQPIIIKRVKKAHHAHHGGAWKIAYADFVTAMMAFFLLLWLISMTTPEQKEGLADYFAPPNVSRTDSGAGGVLGGTAMASDGAKMAGSSANLTTAAVIVPDTPGRGPHSESANGRDGSAENQAATASQTDLQSNHDQVFHSAAASIRQAWQAMPELAEILDNLLVEVTEDGLDIQFIDQTGRAMFPEGSKYPIEPVRQAIAAVAPILQQLPNRIRISGHTAAGGNYVDPRYGPWELSSDRANIVRTLLSEFGLEDSHIASVVGEASADPYFPNDPYLAANERIKITVLREAPPFPPDMTP